MSAVLMHEATQCSSIFAVCSLDLLLGACMIAISVQLILSLFILIEVALGSLRCPYRPERSCRTTQPRTLAGKKNISLTSNSKADPHLPPNLFDLEECEAALWLRQHRTLRHRCEGRRKRTRTATRKVCDSASEDPCNLGLADPPSDCIPCTTLAIVGFVLPAPPSPPLHPPHSTPRLHLQMVLQDCRCNMYMLTSTD